MPPSVVLLSGGLDSTVNLALAVEKGPVVLAITADYGQRAAMREMAAARALCRHYGVRHRRIALRWLSAACDAPLVRRDAPLPDPRLEGEAQADARVWVPNRNGVLVNAAAAFAEALGAVEVVAGFNAEEAANFPDNSAAFLGALDRCFEHSARGRVRAVSYTVEMTKAEILRIARDREVPLERAWWCYDDGPAPCWRCSSCVRFARAAHASGTAEWLASRGVSVPSPE